MITSMPRVAIATHDFERCVETFRQDYGLPVIDLSPGSVESLGAKLAMCVPEGGSNIELMSPANPQAPLSQSLSRFLERRGEGLFALMLEAPDPDREAAALVERGLNVLPRMAGAGGRDVHPNSTAGVLIRVYPMNSFAGERSASTSGLSGIMRVVVAVLDLDHARRVYQKGFGLACDASVRRRLARSARASSADRPAGGVIEFVTPMDAEPPVRAGCRRLPGRSPGPLRPHSARRLRSGLRYRVWRAHTRRGRRTRLTRLCGAVDSGHLRFASCGFGPAARRGSQKGAAERAMGRCLSLVVDGMEQAAVERC